MSLASFAAVQILRALPRTRISRAVGQLCETRLPPRLSNALVRVYAATYGIDLDECEAPPGASYVSFDAFFTRALQPGRRDICVSHADVASPADGQLQSVGRVDRDGVLLVKGRPYGVAELTGDPSDAERYLGGHFAVVYLSPRDYHRVHAPVSGSIGLVRSLPGDRFPVNSLGERHVPSLFARNRRVAIVIESGLGRVTVVMVGAIVVGRITVSALPYDDVPVGVHEVSPAKSVNKGEEIGVFHLGSTAIVFAPSGFAAPFARAPGPVRVGQSLAGTHE